MVFSCLNPKPGISHSHKFNLKSKKLITVLLILIIFLSSTLVYIFAKEKLSYDPKYHINPAEKIEEAFANYEIGVCRKEKPNSWDNRYSSNLKDIYTYLDKSKLSWILSVATEPDSTGIIHSYVRIDEALNKNWSKISDIKKSKAIEFITNEIASKYKLNHFEIWVVDCTGEEKKFIGFSSYDTQTREQKEQIEIYFDW